MRWVLVAAGAVSLLIAGAQEVRAQSSQSTTEGDPLSYTVWEPSSTHRHTPILIALHGAGSTGTKMGNLVKRLMRLPVRIILPNAPFPTRRGHSWYKIRSASSDSDVGLSIERLADLLETLKVRWPNAPLPYLIGYSQGAVVALRFTAEYPEAIAGTIALAGYLVPDDLAIAPAKSGAPKLFLAHGRRDRAIPFQEGREAAEAFRTQGYDVKFVPHGAGHGCPRPVWKAASAWFRKHTKASTQRP